MKYESTHVGPNGLNPEAIELAKEVLAQNRIVLDMNARLLAVLSTVRLVVEHKEAP